MADIEDPDHGENETLAVAVAMGLIHLSQVTIAIYDRSASNFDSILKRPKGPLPLTRTITIWGQVHQARENERQPIAQGEYPKSDGYVLVEKPITYTPARGDRITSIDNRTVSGEIVAVADETEYGEGYEWVRLDYLWDYDA